MGGSRWSDDYYEDRAATNKAAGIDPFAYDKAVKTGAKPTAVHNKLDPKGVLRESRDSTAHPDSNAIMVWFDVTGSMAGVPRILQANLPKLHGLLTRKGYITDPQVLFGAIGDATSDKVPLQVGQFESGNEMEDDLANIFLEGNGGGQTAETYELAMYFSMHKTALDCFEKRGRKGYLFMIGDEKSYPMVKSAHVASLLGDTLEADIPTETMVKRLQEKFHCYFIIPKMTSYFSEPWLKAHWTGLFGQNVLYLDDPAGICECIALAIGINEGVTDIIEAEAHLKEVGSSSLVVRSATSAVSHLAGAGGMVKVTGSSLVPGDATTSGSKRI